MPNVIITRNTYPDDRALHYVIHYALDKAVAVGGYGVSTNAEAAYMQMQFVKRAFYQSDTLQLKHFMITIEGIRFLQELFVMRRCRWRSGQPLKNALPRTGISWKNATASA